MRVRCCKCGYDSWCGFVDTSASTVGGVGSLLQVRVRLLVWVRCYKCGYYSWCGFVVTSACTIVGVGSLLQERVR